MIKTFKASNGLLNYGLLGIEWQYEKSVYLILAFKTSLRTRRRDEIFWAPCVVGSTTAVISKAGLSGCCGSTVITLAWNVKKTSLRHLTHLPDSFLKILVKIKLAESKLLWTRMVKSSFKNCARLFGVSWNWWVNVKENLNLPCCA